MSVFFNSGSPPEETVRELEQLLSINLRRVTAGDLVRYECEGVGYDLVLFADHGLIDDRGIRFSHYKYQCDVDVRDEGVRDDTAATLRRGLAQYVFDKIVSNRQWPSMMVFNLQELVESYEPDGGRSNGSPRLSSD